MTIDKTLRVKSGAISNRNVLTRAERIEKLKEAERWHAGDAVLGLPKVRVLKLALKKKKKAAKVEEGAEGAAAKPAAGAAGAKPAAGAAAKPAAGAKAAPKKSRGLRALAEAAIMRVKFEYGRTGLYAELPDERIVRTLRYKDAVPLPDPHGSLMAVLEKPAGTPPLAELAKGKRDACIVICDITRPVPNEMILRPMLEILEGAGIPREKITILVATGLHRPNEGDELIEMVGRHIAENYRIENHHGQVLEEHTFLGNSPRGVPIWIDSHYVKADLKITTGLIEPHLMAGFSGGRKLICPGIAALETVKVWHGPDFLEHPKADCGILEGNPVHEENTWIGRHTGCDFIVNVVIDSDRRALKWVAGDMVAAFHEGVDFVRGVVRDTVKEPVDIVVTSCAGYPLDTTFYQAVKGLTGALPIVKQGGTIVMCASLTEGIGSPQFQQLFQENDNLEGFVERILGKDYFVMDQWQLEELAKVRRKAKVKIVSSGLPAATINGLFVESAPTIEAAVAASLAEYGPAAKMAVIPKGPYVLAQVA